METDNQNANGNNASNNLEGFIKAEDLNLSSTPASLEQQNLEQQKLANEKLEQEKLVQEENKKLEQEKLEQEKLKSQQVPEIEINGVKHTLNENGDALNEKGEIVKTKAQLAELEIIDDAIPLVDELIQKVGIEILDKNGKPKKFEDSVEGIIEASKAVAEIKAKQTFDSLLNADPRFKRYYDYLKTGGDEKEYFNQRNNSWVDVKFDENNEDMALSAVIARLTKNGFSREQAELTANMYKDTNKLKEFGKDAYNTLVQEEKLQEKTREENYKALQKQEEERTIEHWQNVKAIIDKGILNNITIPDNDREAFYKWKALAVKDGLSQADIDLNQTPNEQLLQLEYLRYKGFDLSKLITNEVQKQKVKSLRDRIAVTQKGVGGGEGPDKGKYTKPDDLSISLDSVMTGTTKK